MWKMMKEMRYNSTFFGAFLGLRERSDDSHARGQSPRLPPLQPLYHIPMRIATGILRDVENSTQKSGNGESAKNIFSHPAIDDENPTNSPYIFTLS
jgi:hypothetical protein